MQIVNFYPLPVSLFCHVINKTPHLGISHILQVFCLHAIICILLTRGFGDPFY